MSTNYNSTLQSNNTDLQAILNTINELPEVNLQNKTVTPTTSQQTVTADGGYGGLSKVTVNAMPTTTQATPSVSIDSNGLITATVTQTSGYVTAGTKSATKQLAFQSAKTITPTTASQIAVSSGYYTGGNITVKGDSNLVAENIKSGVSIFGVSGNYVGSGSSGNTVETCTIVFDSKWDDNLYVCPVVLSVYEDGIVKPYTFASSKLKDATVDNVVCGSPIVLANITNLYNYDTYGIQVSGGVEIFEMNSENKYVILRAPTTSYTTGTILFVCA